MEGCVVLFNPRIHLFACTHPSVSSTCDCNALLVYKHQSTALCSNTFGWWFFVCVQASASSPVLQTRLDCGSLFVYKHQSPTLCFKHVWMMVPCLCTRISLQPCVSDTFGLWFPVCVHASVNSPLFQTRLIMVTCSGRSTGRGSARWVLFPTNTWEPLLLTWVCR